MSIRTEATIEGLCHVPENGKAEIVDGELVLMSPTGDLPGSATGEIFASLREYARRTKPGRAYSDNVGPIVNLPNRKSFSPDAAFYIGPRSGGKFLTGAPVFAVEVRSESDYGPNAERAMEKKRADYLAAGTLVAWVVDLLKGEMVRAFTADDPENPIIYHRGEAAYARAALPDWPMPVDDLFA
ncbi:MAG TPA: Uma2 family endonuclease [Blastocatellia bacterium]|jgi:Uma2 family endonuclease